jgi:hypothetical protein
MSFDNIYNSQATVFKSYSAMRNALFNGEFTVIKHDSKTREEQKNEQKVKNVLKPIPFKEDQNILLAIQNNSVIMHFVVNCKGHKDLLAYIYIESSDFINFIIKNPNGYPLILARIPTDDLYIFTRVTNCVFDFPIKDMLQKDTKYAKKSIYNIIYRKSDSDTHLTNVQFIYELYSSDNNINTSFTLQNIRINSLNIVNNLFKLPLPEIKLTDETQYINGFKSLNVLVLRYVSDISSMLVLTNKSIGKYSFKIEIIPNMIRFVSVTSRQNTVQEIATRANSLIWNIETNEGEYLMLPFENMFKANFNKIYNYFERVYYIFGTFLNIYVLIKCASPILINDKATSNVLNKIFDGKYQFYECYYCVIKK